MAAKKPIAVVIGMTNWKKLIFYQIFLILIIGVGPGLGASLAKRYNFIHNISLISKFIFLFKICSWWLFNWSRRSKWKESTTGTRRTWTTRPYRLFYFFLSNMYVNIWIFDWIAVSVAADAGDISSLKNAFNTIRTKLGNDLEVLLYNASGFQYGKLDISHCINFFQMLFLLY